jgi:hypothetical protein
MHAQREVKIAAGRGGIVFNDRGDVDVRLPALSE